MLEAVLPNLVSGGILVADNAISHEAELRPMLDRALADERVDAMIVPIGKEILPKEIGESSSDDAQHVDHAHDALLR